MNDEINLLGTFERWDLHTVSVLPSEGGAGNTRDLGSRLLLCVG